MRVDAYAVPAPSEPLVPVHIERRPVGPGDVLIETDYVGICHTDIHSARSEWGPRVYPLVLGHEVVGRVVEVGDDVTCFRRGDRVGVGPIVDSCGRCSSCVTGEEQYCLNEATWAYGSVDRNGAVTQGGYATHTVVSEDFVVAIPEQIPAPNAAPLLCAGISSFAPLRRRRVGPGMKVAVVGIGGLGHLAVKFAHAMGAEVVAISSTATKQDSVLEMGADYFYPFEEELFTGELVRSFDVVVLAMSSAMLLDPFIAMLRHDGTLLDVGMPGSVVANSEDMRNQRRHITGSLLGGMQEMREMLDFAAAHRIWADVELIDIGRVNEAYDRVVKAEVRYCAVIDAHTLRSTAPVSAERGLRAALAF